MYLNSLSLTHFKNLSSNQFEFSTKLNAIVGQNGVGKTNVLDAIYYLCYTKSYLNYIDIQNIEFQEGFFVIQGVFHKNEKDYEIRIALQKDSPKTITKNGKKYPKISDHIGEFNAVMISPYDRNLILEGSDTRRKFLDGMISQVDGMYLQSLLQYNKALQQRNALLKYFRENNTFSEDSLEMYNAVLIQHGNQIHQKRQTFIEEYKKNFQHFYSTISEDKEVVEVIYQSSLFEENMEELLQSSVKQDVAAQYTTQGIHKEDLLFTIKENPVKKFGSQGQQKSFLIALKLAQFEIITELTGHAPILLLDDVFDKLDEKRVAQIIKMVQTEKFGQIFITDTHPERIQKLFQEVDSEHHLIELS